MKDKEILNALSNVNINSDTAEIVMREWAKVQYVEMGLIVLLVVIFLGAAMAFLFFSSRPND